MIRAGKMDRTIAIERLTVAVDEYGATQETWTTVKTVRAQLIQSTAKEFIKDFGASGETTCAFRIRYLIGLTLADRVTYDGKIYDLKEIVEVGRRKALELRALQRA